MRVERPAVGNDGSEGTSQYLEDLKIDHLALDIEWLEQAQIFFKYGEKSARENRELDRVKQKYEVVCAKADAKIRSSYEDKKPTEAAIRSALALDKDVLEVAEELREQKYNHDISVVGVRAFDQRKSALENMVKLQAQNYFASPKEPRNLQTEYDKRVKQKEAYSRLAASSKRER